MVSGEQPQSERPLFAWNLRRCEGLFSWASLAILLLLHLLLQLNADAFWRDEVSSILLAKAPTWKEVWNNFGTDSFPALWMAVLRAWRFIGMGAGDWWLRLLGLVLSAGIFAAMFAVARRLRMGLPVLAIGLLGGIPAVFYWGDSVRAYALACILIGLLFGWVWSYVEHGERGVGFAAAFIAILAAQSNYQNSYLIFGICVAGALVAALNRHWGRAAATLGVGAGAAASYLPYWEIITRYQAGVSTQTVTPITLGLVWGRFTDGFEGVKWTILPALLILASLVLLAPIWTWFTKRSRPGAPAGMAPLIYAASALLISGLSCLAFIKFQGFPTNCWYYLPILTVSVLCIEMTLASYKELPAVRWTRLAVALLLFLAALPALWKQANLRRTSIDLAAFQIAKKANARDFVMVQPYFLSVSFGYYYNGTAPWSLLPVVPENERMDYANAVNRVLASETPLAATFARLSQTLQNGGRVWVVNGLPILPDDFDLAKWKKANPALSDWKYLALEIDLFLQKHSTAGAVHRVIAGLPVCGFEQINVIFVYEGWRN